MKHFTENDLMMRLTILSMACCNPSLAKFDEKYLELISQVLKETGIEASVDLVHATEARMIPSYAFTGAILPLFSKYGQAVTPALFINESLTLYGGVPTAEKLTETFKKAEIAISQGRL